MGKARKRFNLQIRKYKKVPSSFSRILRWRLKSDLLLRYLESKLKYLQLLITISVGSGKTSLFNSLLGEMHHNLSSIPSIEINGSIAFVSQKPWIINATIKENIIFGKKYDAEVYKEALKASCLESDLKALVKGDETEIGEKGLNLSGGQKARVALARAIYSNSDIYLLDDPLR